MFDRIVSSIGVFSYRNRKVISIVALVLFLVVFILQSQLIIEYSYAEESIVNDIFPQDDTMVLVYDNLDEERMGEIISYLEADEHITSIQGYANTLGMQMSPAEISGTMGVPEILVNALFYMYQNGMEVKGMTLVELVNFISSDAFLNNDLFASMMNDETKGQLVQMRSIVDALANDREYTAEEISDIIGVEKQIVQSIFFIAQLKDASFINITPIFWANVAEVLGMQSETIEQLFKIQPVKSLKFTEFIDIVTEVVGYAGGIIDAEQISQLNMLKDMSDIVAEGKVLYPDDLLEIFSGAVDNEMFNESTLPLLFLMAKGNSVSMADTRISLYDFFMFLSEDILTNDTFSTFFDEGMLTQFDEAKATIQSGIEMLVGPHYSRMVITLDYTPESEEIYAFYDNFHSKLDSTLSGEYYIVGMTAMSYEVAQSFETEYLIISIVTAIAVFIVVWFTFKKFFVSLLLIGVIECAVFSMMSVMVIINLPMYFVPLILVQCILMGSMIDYGILFTTYYMEVRKEYEVRDALPEVMRRSTHSILTSSLLIVLVTLICGRFMSGAVASILTTLGIGSLCAILLILFVLPSLLVIFDKYIVKKETEKVEVAETTEITEVIETTEEIETSEGTEIVEITEEPEITETVDEA